MGNEQMWIMSEVRCAMFQTEPGTTFEIIEGGPHENLIVAHTRSGDKPMFLGAQEECEEMMEKLFAAIEDGKKSFDFGRY